MLHLLRACSCLPLLAVTAVCPAAVDDPGALAAALEVPCTFAEAPPPDALAALGAASGLRVEPLAHRGVDIGWRARVATGDGGAIVVERIAPGGRLRRASVEVHEASADGPRPALAVVAGPQCAVRAVRRLRYDAGGRAVRLEHLSPGLDRVLASEPLDAEVPPGRDPGGVTVAHVDSGVNYLLPEIGARLARDAAGRALGHDYWDGDDRPFDANPAGSAFFPQRHGTATASVLLGEADGVRLLPYRYPRPDMARMADLVEHAAANGARVVSLSLGSGRASDWRAFEAAARAHPRILFLASAGNDGRDLDLRPVYPAALALDNLLSVTSVETDGAIAPGSNWGAASVQLGVPAERVPAIGFDGEARLVSGSSYAVVRLAALAACLLAAEPGGDAAWLRARLLALARPDPGARLAHGVILDLDTPAAPGCPDRAAPVRVEALGEWPVAPQPGARDWLALSLDVVEVAGSGWRIADARAAVDALGPVLAQCGLRLSGVRAWRVRGPYRMRFFHDRYSSDLMAALAPEGIAVVLVRDSLQPARHDAEAVGRANSRRRPALAGSIWVSAGARDLPVSLAHELLHVLADSGGHHEDPANLMHERTAGDNTALTDWQCDRARRVGEALGYLRRL